MEYKATLKQSGDGDLKYRGSDTDTRLHTKKKKHFLWNKALKRGTASVITGVGSTL